MHRGQAAISILSGNVSTVRHRSDRTSGERKSEESSIWNRPSDPEDDLRRNKGDCPLYYLLLFDRNVGNPVMKTKFRYDRPVLIEMSMQSATGGATVCYSGINQANCKSGSCVALASCRNGDYPTNCSTGNTALGTCSFCGTGDGVDAGFDTLFCTTGGTAAGHCIQGVVAGRQCSRGTTIVACRC